LRREKQMFLHEFQAKRLLASAGVPVPAGVAANSVSEALAAAHTLGGTSWVVKAQVHAGGRGKAGGVRSVDRAEEIGAAARELLHTRLVTHQTGANGLPVSWLLVEQPVSVEREVYLATFVDRTAARVVFMGCRTGGMDIEQAAAQHPEDILLTRIEPVVGLQPYQCRRLAFGMGLADKLKDISGIMSSLYQLLLRRDASLIEINPLVLTTEGRLLALDVKLILDDNALYRQPDLAELRDPSQEEEREVAARRFGLSYVTLDGNIACMVNGAGLAMATMDLIKLHGGEPANFLDVGGSATADRVSEAFKLILGDPKVRAVLVNIFGGIVRCDLIAEGLMQALQDVAVRVPVVVRLEGTQVERGRALLAQSGLNILTAQDLDDAARRAVAAAT
jgi:succinyl-CoA synthetase beta subunit